MTDKLNEKKAIRRVGAKKNIVAEAKVLPLKEAKPKAIRAKKITTVTVPIETAAVVPAEIPDVKVVEKIGVLFQSGNAQPEYHEPSFTIDTDRLSEMLGVVEANRTRFAPVSARSWTGTGAESLDLDSEFVEDLNRPVRNRTIPSDYDQVTLFMRSSTAQNVSEWFRQFDRWALFGVVYNPKHIKFSPLFRFSKKSKTVRVSFRGHPFGTKEEYRAHLNKYLPINYRVMKIKFSKSSVSARDYPIPVSESTFVPTLRRWKKAFFGKLSRKFAKMAGQSNTRVNHL